MLFKFDEGTLCVFRMSVGSFIQWKYHIHTTFWDRKSAYTRENRRYFVSTTSLFQQKKTFLRIFHHGPRLQLLIGSAANSNAISHKIINTIIPKMWKPNVFNDDDKTKTFHLKNTHKNNVAPFSFPDCNKQEYFMLWNLSAMVHISISAYNKKISIELLTSSSGWHSRYNESRHEYAKRILCK